MFFSPKRLSIHTEHQRAVAPVKETIKSRHIIFVRHGQYLEGKAYKEDQQRILTPLGRKQADLTGQRLAQLASVDGLGEESVINAIHVSDLTRAKETAKIIASYLPQVPLKDPDPMLNECTPSELLKKAAAGIPHRVDRVFSKFFFRAPPNASNDKMKHEFEIIVGHGNVIRYITCLALSLPHDVWLRLSTANCSITYLVIHPNGAVTCRHMGDVGHLGYDNVSYSGDLGYDW